ncbi:MAG TPA: hypothetical protein PL141_10970, partial [Thermoflexales bacterium]|nr:hypothetical protein [Thermoflexales bacterium]
MQVQVGSDTASNTPYNDGWASGDDGGTGFGAWTLGASSGNNGYYVASSGPTGNESNIGTAWAMWANSGSDSYAFRNFDTAMVPGDVFTLQMDNSSIDTNAKVGFSLQDAGGNNVADFYFTGGNSAYTLQDSTITATSVGWTNTGLSISIKMLSSTQYEITITPIGGSAVTYTRTFGPSTGAPARISIYNNHAGSGSDHNAYFSNLNLYTNVQACPTATATPISTATPTNTPTNTPTPTPAPTTFACLTSGTSTSSTSIVALGDTYCQNFESLATTGSSTSLPSGWVISETGTSGNITYTAGTGSINTGETYSFGSTTTPADRALGGLQSGPVVPMFGAFFTNSTGSVINSLVITYTGEQWRLGATSRTDILSLTLSTNATSLTSGTWVTPSALAFVGPITTGTIGPLDGNATANRTTLAATISGLSIAPGATFWVRWIDYNPSG